jgi:hypothetical protein
MASRQGKVRAQLLHQQEPLAVSHATACLGACMQPAVASRWCFRASLAAHLHGHGFGRVPVSTVAQLLAVAQHSEAPPLAAVAMAQLKDSGQRGAGGDLLGELRQARDHTFTGTMVVPVACSLAANWHSYMAAPLRVIQEQCKTLTSWRSYNLFLGAGAWCMCACRPLRAASPAPAPCPAAQPTPLPAQGCGCCRGSVPRAS